MNQLYTFSAGVILAVIMVGAFVWLMMDNQAKDGQILNLTAQVGNLTKNLSDYNTMRTFINDFREYSEVCNVLYQSKVPPLQDRCREMGADFVNYYVGFPNNDYILICNKAGKAEILRFR